MIQVAACLGGRALVPPFNAYILPVLDVSQHVQGLTGFAKVGGSLTLRGQPVAAGTRGEAVRGLLDFLRQVGAAGKPVLVAHGAFSSDGNQLIRLVAAEGQLERLAELVQGFADTVPLLQEALPDRPGGKGSFSLPTLSRDFGVSA